MNPQDYEADEQKAKQVAAAEAAAALVSRLIEIVCIASPMQMDNQANARGSNILCSLPPWPCKPLCSFPAGRSWTSCCRSSTGKQMQLKAGMLDNALHPNRLLGASVLPGTSCLHPVSSKV
jgi:hypothetical protein